MPRFASSLATRTWPSAGLKRFKTLEAKAAQEHLILTEDQLRALERSREDKVAHGEIETEHPGTAWFVKEQVVPTATSRSPSRCALQHGF